MVELKTLRKSTHLTQTELAEVLKVPVSTYSKWEQGINRPTDSQVYLTCYYLYKEGYVKTYLNDPKLTLTESGMIMAWLRRADETKFVENSKRDICNHFQTYVTKDEADRTYKKLYKHYVMSRKVSLLEYNRLRISEDEFWKTAYRALNAKGVEILPYDAGAIRSSAFDADEYFFFSRLSNMLRLDENKIKEILLRPCHENFFTQCDLSASAMAVMNCLYYKYYLLFPLCFDAVDLIRNYGNEFRDALDELVQKGYAAVSGREYYEFYPDHKSCKDTELFYVPKRLLELTT